MKRFIFFLPIALLGLTTLGYYVWWNYAAAQMENIVHDWIKSIRNEGYQAYHSSPVFTGFPLNLSMTMAEPFIITPDASFSYKGVALVVETLPWNPTKYRLNIVGSQTVQVSKNNFNEIYNISAADAFALTDIGLDGKLKRIDLITKGLKIQAETLKDQLTIDDFSLAVVLPPSPAVTGEDTALTLQFIAENTYLPKAIKSPFTPRIRHLSSRLNIKGPLKNGTPLEALSNWQANGGKLNILELNLKWDELQLSAHGEAALDEKYYPLAALEAEIAGLGATMITLADRGVIDARIAKISAVGLQLMAKKPVDGGPATVNIPISTQGGAFYLGPLHIADIPNLMGRYTTEIPDAAVAAPVGRVEVDNALPDLAEPPTVNFDTPAN